MVKHPISYGLSLDLVKSRRVKDRAAFVIRLKQTLAEAGHRFAGDWLKPPVISRGIDEVSAALKRPDHAFDFLVWLNLALWPQRFRLGVGVGVIDIGLRGDAADLDGTAFHNAAEAVRRAARDGLPFAIEAPSIPTPQGRIAETLALFHGNTIAEWKPRMHDAAIAYRSTGTQQDAARKLKVTQQSVSRTLARAHHEHLLTAEDSLRLWLESLRIKPHPESLLVPKLKLTSKATPIARPANKRPR